MQRKFFLLLIAFQITTLAFSQRDTEGKINADSCSIFVPNIISQNCGHMIHWQDGLFVLSTCAVAEFQICIYNRWGELMYKTTEVNEMKEIKWNWEKFPVATYYWFVDYKFAYTEAPKKSIHGTFTTIK